MGVQHVIVAAQDMITGYNPLYVPIGKALGWLWL